MICSGKIELFFGPKKKILIPELLWHLQPSMRKKRLFNVVLVG